MDEYPPGVRAPGEGYTGPIADPDKAVRAVLASEDVLAQAARDAADPDAPVKAYLSAKEAWETPWKYAGWPRPGATPVPASVRVPSQAEAERNADAIRAGMGQARAAEMAGTARSETKHAGLDDFRGRPPGWWGKRAWPGSTLCRPTSSAA